MKIQATTDHPDRLKVDLIVSFQPSEGEDPAFEKLDAACDGRLKKRLKEDGFQWTAGEIAVIDTRDFLPSKLVAVIAAAAHDDGGATVRDFAAQAIRCGERFHAKSVALLMPKSRNEASDAFLATLGAQLGSYRFTKYKSKKDGASTPKRVKLIFSKKKKKAKAKGGVGKEMAAAHTVAKAVALARDLVNEPAGYMSPRRIASVAKKIASGHPTLKIKVLGRKECEKLGMGMYLAVARGAKEEPYFIHMTYRPEKPSASMKRIALVGKGVMFDSGGYSLKPSDGMLTMKMDMGGAAAVIATMSAVAELGVGHEVHAVAACCENMVSGDAYKLGDVLQAMDGSTVEVINTDAEGRLTLGDAITYTRNKIKPDQIFDFATLTGACIVALGPYRAAIMSDDDEMAIGFEQAGERMGEDFWRLPLDKKLNKHLKSDIADRKNCGPRWGSSITAGLFLSHFAGDARWCHVDIAGPAFLDAEEASSRKGGTGFPVATILEYLRRAL